ncbi:MAG: AAA family ATPase, partial [Candidatus Aenigmatarchaeota archaeon]
LDRMKNANLSPENYNIVMQGDVARIIEMSALERRTIIDDIAGISEFDEKREKAQRELEKVEMLVRENMIVMSEKQRLVARLRQEKENAEKYEKLNKELRKSKASLFKKKFAEVNSRMKESDAAIGSATAEFDKFEKTFGTLDTTTDSLDREIQQLGDEIIKKSKNYGIIRDIDKINTEILRKKDRIAMNERDIQRLSDTGLSDTTKTILSMNIDGVYGTFSSLVSMPKKYETALDVAIGGHAHDIVVSTDDVAIKCVYILKEKKAGRARFLPLNRIRGEKRHIAKHPGMIGHSIDLIKFDEKFSSAVNYVLGETAVCDTIEHANKMECRAVTIDGDLKEKAGAIIGGFYRKRPDISHESRRLEDENKTLEDEIETLLKKVEELEGLEKEESKEVTELQKKKFQKSSELEKMKKERKDVYEKRTILQNKLSKLKIDRAHIEAAMDNLKLDADEYNDVKDFYNLSIEELQEKSKNYIAEINRLGPVNMKAIEEFGTINVEFEELKKKLDRLLEEKDSVLAVANDIEKRRYEKFIETLGDISTNFSKVFNDMSGGSGTLRLEEEGKIDTGLIIEASLPNKGTLNLDSISGGEKTVTSLAFLFAIMEHYSAPFYVLDEVDAALDKVNTKRITNMIKKYSHDKQFIVITHNDITTAEADKVFGVSMEGGVSKVFGLEMPKARE